MTFERAMKEGDLDVARTILDELVAPPQRSGMPNCILLVVGETRI
jgi:hypothetical protein